MNGYTRITINGKEYGIKFTMWAIEKISELEEKYPSSSDKIVNMIFAGLLNNCRHNKTELEIKYEDLTLIVDEMYNTVEGQSAIRQVNDCLEQSGSYKYVMELAEDAKKKEQLNGMKSTASLSES